MKRQARPGEGGAALLVVTVLLLLVGTAMVFGAGIFRFESDIDRERTTVRKVDRLMDHLASHVQQHDRLPCPADPAAAAAAFGTEDIQPGPVPTRCRLAEGIVPFRALNISSFDARDGWSRYVTYAVSAVFADTLTNPPSAAASIFWRCRAPEWIDQRNLAVPADDVPKDQFKARFCCPSGINPYPATQDIQITGETALPRVTDPARMAAAATLEAGDPGGSVETWAAVLVSHGRNGFGAYLANGTANRLPGTGLSAAESENADGGDRIYQTAMRNYIAGPNYFDDVILYRTQSRLYAELNNGTCERAWR